VIGHTLQAIRVYQGRNVDELVYLDVDAKDGPDFRLIEQFAGECFMPLTVGGGVKTVEHFRQLLRAGADKVCINTAAVVNPELITQAAEKFGRQAVVVSIDVRFGQVVKSCGKVVTDRNALQWAQEVARLGAGEILLNSIPRDGTMSGYDLDLVESVSGAVDIPVIACGGAGAYSDFKLALDRGAHAVAASALWAFTDATPAEAAEYLHKLDVPVRRKIAA
jgi:cyclase